MITGKIITGLVIALLLIQFLPLSHSNDSLYDDDSSELCIIKVSNDDDSNLNNLLLFQSAIPSQQIIGINWLNTERKLFPGFPACIYFNYSTDIFIPPPDIAGC